MYLPVLLVLSSELQVFFFEQNMLDDDQGIENNWFPSGLTVGD